MVLYSLEICLKYFGVFHAQSKWLSQVSFTLCSVVVLFEVPRGQESRSNARLLLVR